MSWNVLGEGQASPFIREGAPVAQKKIGCLK